MLDFFHIVYYLHKIYTVELNMNSRPLLSSIRPQLGRSYRKFHTSRPSRLELITLLNPIYDGMQFAHSAGGLQWHTVLPLAAIALRSAVTLPLSIANRLRVRKQAQLQLLLGAATPIMKAKLANSQAAKNGTITFDQIEVLVNKERRKRRVELFKKHKCQVWKLVILPAVQIPLWISVSMVIRSMCGWAPIDGLPLEHAFRSDSFLWFNDLLVTDPYGVLPMAIGAVSLANMEWNAKNINNSSRATGIASTELTIPNLLATASRFGAIFFMSIAFQAPVALCIYWLASNVFSLVQNITLDILLPARYEPPRDGISPDVMAIEDSSN